MTYRLLATLLASALLAATNCGTQNRGTDSDAASSGSATSSGSPTSSGSASSSGGECNEFASTNEGCQIGGPSPGVCPAMPKGWAGTALPGEACGDGTDCKGIVCKCEEPSVQEWYVGVCACDVCADYAVACAEANVVGCTKITPQ